MWSSTWVQINLHDVTLRHHLDPLHLPLGQHLVHKVVPGDVGPLPVLADHEAKHQHHEGEDQQCPQTFQVYLVFPSPALLFLCRKKIAEEKGLVCNCGIFWPKGGIIKWQRLTQWYFWGVFVLHVWFPLKDWVSHGPTGTKPTKIPPNILLG